MTLELNHLCMRSQNYYVFWSANFRDAHIQERSVGHNNVVGPMSVTRGGATTEPNAKLSVSSKIVLAKLIF